MKKIIIMLALVLSTIITGSNIRAGINYDEKLIESVEESVVEMGFYEKKSNYTFGNPINVYEFVDNKLEVVNNASNYQVYKDGKLILLVLVTENAIKIYEPNPELCSLTNDPDFRVVIKETSAYAITMSECKLVESLPGTDVFELTDEEISEARTKVTGYCTDAVVSINPEQNEINSPLAGVFPSIAQNPYPNGCWCACIAAFCNYYKSLSYTAATVANQYYPGTAAVLVPTASMTTIKTRLQNGYHILTTYINSAVIATIVSNLSPSNNKMYILGWTSSLGGHVTCMYDYELKNDGKYKFWIMDPYGYVYMSSGARKYTIEQTGTAFPSNDKLFGGSNGTYTFSEGLVYSSHY